MMGMAVVIMRLVVAVLVFLFVFNILLMFRLIAKIFKSATSGLFKNLLELFVVELERTFKFKTFENFVNHWVIRSQNCF